MISIAISKKSNFFKNVGSKMFYSFAIIYLLWFIKLNKNVKNQSPSNTFNIKRLSTDRFLGVKYRQLLVLYEVL